MENTKVNYSLYYYIPWPDWQKLWDDNSIREELTLAEAGGLFVEKYWFENNRDNYGL